MPKDKSSSKGSKSDKGSDLEDMRDAFRRHKERSSGGGGGGGTKDWDKLGDGKNNRRVLPRPGEKKFYTEGWTHFNIGPNDRAVRCIDEDNIDVERGLPKSETKCPICKKFLREQSRINSEYEKGDKDGHAEWKRAKDKYVARHQYYANVLVEDDDGESVSVKILAFGTQIWSQLLNYYLGDDTAIGDFTHPKSGRWMNLKKEKKGGRDRRNVEYKVFPASESSDISDSWDDIKEMLHDLDAAVGKILSKDEIIAIMKGIDLNKGSDDGDDDEDEDEDDDDSSSDSGSDDEEEEEDGDDDDDDDDDRSSRTKKKKSKLSMKMNKKRRGDD